MPELRVIPGALCLDGKAPSAAPAVERALETLQQEHFLILNAAGEGIYGLDLEGHATFVNPSAAAMTGHRVDELIGRSMHDVVHHSRPDGGRYPREDCPIYAAFCDGMRRQVGDEVFWRKDGTSFSVEYTSTPIIEHSRLVGAVVVFRDITLRKLTEERLRQALGEVERLKERLQAENRYLKERIQRSEKLRTLVGESREIENVLRLARKAAASDATVLVEGETGTGKELVCRAIHDFSARRERPFVTMNCAALSPTLIESELFGHEKGAFTGANTQRVGRFEAADGGTLVLDEVGELSLEAQAKLLRVLQERQFERVGGIRTLTTSARVVAATNRDLREQVRAGRFREDLFYRLYVFPIRVPPLRERRADIPLLAQHFLERSASRWGLSCRGFTPQSQQRLLAHDWPGNVRELEHTVERAVLVSDSPWVDLVPLASDSTVETPLFDALSPSDPPDSHGRLDVVQREHILSVLRQTGARISGASGAAAVLGMHPNTLRYRMKKLGIARPE